MKILYICFFVTALLLCSCTSTRFVEYEIFEIEGLDGKASAAVSVNNKGEIAGEVCDEEGNRAFFMNPNGEIVYFKCPSFTETKIITVNDNSLVLGYGLNTNGDYQSFVWSSKGCFCYPVNSNGKLDLRDLNNKNVAMCIQKNNVVLTFKSQADAAAHIGSGNSSMCMLSKGKLKTLYGWSKIDNNK